jgi:hypothetical protein
MQADMKTYNDIEIPHIIRTNRIVSAFSNSIDPIKVNEYSNIMRINDVNYGNVGFPPILGFPSIIDEDDISNEEFRMMDFDSDDYQIGDLIWKVTDGHHRTLAAIKAGIHQLEVELDYSCITNEKEL